MSDQIPVLDRLTRRNPVPNPADPPVGAWDLDGVRLELMRREDAMLTKETTTGPAPLREPPRRNWLVAAAAFIAVLIFGVVFFFGGGDPADDVVTDPTTTAPTSTVPTTEATPAPTTVPPAFDPFATADEIIAAIYSNDMARVDALASETANLEIARYLAGWVEVQRDLSNVEIFGSVCEPTAASNVIECTVEYTDDMVRAAGADRLAETWEIGFANEQAQTLNFRPPDPDPLASASRALVALNPRWFEVGGPCEGLWAYGDPATCAPLWNDFVIGWFTPPTPETLVENAESLVAALYSDDRPTVEALESESSTRRDVVYYFLGWFQGLETKVISSECAPGAASNQVLCTVVASDALQGAFGVDSFEVEWAFQFSGRLWQTVEFPPPLTEDNTADQWLMDFVAANTDLFGPPLGICDGFFSGGSTAFECGQTVAAAAAEAGG